MSAPLSVLIPMTPPTELSPNRTRNRFKRSRIAAPLKQAAYYATVAALRGEPPPFAPEARIAVGLLIRWERGRKLMDDDNAIASAKEMLDSVAAALEVNDKRFVIRGVEQQKADRDDAGGWVRVTLEAEGGEA